MIDLQGAASRLLARLLGATSSRETDPGTPAVLTGLEAVTVVESLAGSRVVSGRGREALAEALGCTLAGERTAVRIAGSDLGEFDLLRRAVESTLPLVVHLGPEERTGVDVVQAAAETGAMVLVAASVQEAIDLTCVARRAAEAALVPAVVMMDAAVAEGLQDARLPSAPVVRRYLGRVEDHVHAPTPAQELALGRHRRRVPLWTDATRPVMVGGEFDPAMAGRVSVARDVFVGGHVTGLLEEARQAYRDETGRDVGGLHGHRLDRAEILLVTLGSRVEIAEGVADRIRNDGGPRVGVLGLRTVRPWPSELVDSLLGVRTVAVLERGGEAGADGPLTRGLRALLEAVTHNDKGNKGIALGRSGKKPAGGPRVISAVWGGQGLVPEAADLIAWCRRPDLGEESGVHLGMRVLPAKEPYPKRQVLVDGLRRHYPDADRLAVRSEAPLEAGLMPDDAIRIRVPEDADRLPSGTDLARFLHEIQGGHVRALGDQVIVGPGPLRRPGDDEPADIVLRIGANPGGEDAVRRLRREGSLLCVLGPGESLPEALTGLARERNLGVHVLRVAPDLPALLARERVLGGVWGLLIARHGIEVTHRKLASARRELLADQDGSIRDDRIRALEGGLDQVRPATPEELAGAPAPAEPDPTGVLRGLTESGESTVHRLSRFWDHTGLLLRRGESDRVTPDPYLATGAAPARGSLLLRETPAVPGLPAFDPAACTGCGACWTVCPDGAVEPVAAAPRDLVEAGMQLARERGRSAEPLRRLLSRLATGVVSAISGDESELGPALRTAFDSATTSLTDEQRQPLIEAVDAVVDEVGSLPLARTAPFFDEPEGAAKGSGKMLAVLLDADACQDCGLCVAACEPDALTPAPRTPERVEGSRRLRSLPDRIAGPGPEMVEALSSHPDVGPLPAVHLDRRAGSAMVPGAGSEPGSGAALALREVLAVLAQAFEPGLQEMREVVAKLRDELAGTIRDQLASALPLSDLEALSVGLDSLQQPDVDVEEIARRVENTTATGAVDVIRLRRLVAVAREVADLQTSLEERADRPHLSVVLGPGPALDWAGRFPANPWTVPVVVGERAVVDVAMGLVQGSMSEAQAVADILRRARLELDRPREAAAGGHRAPHWDDLDTGERGRAAPVVVVLDQRDTREHPAVPRLLSGNRPVFVVSLLDPGQPGSGLAGWFDAPGVGLAQISLAHADHLARAVRSLGGNGGPGWIRVPAPVPSLDTFPVGETLDRARQLVADRSAPLIVRSPLTDASVTVPFDLGGNPDEGPEPPEWRLLCRLATQPTVSDPGAEERHRSEVAALTAEYEARLAAARRDVRQQLAVQVQNRLRHLLRRTGNNEGDPRA